MTASCILVLPDGCWDQPGPVWLLGPWCWHLPLQNYYQSGTDKHQWRRGNQLPRLPSWGFMMLNTATTTATTTTTTTTQNQNKALWCHNRHTHRQTDMHLSSFWNVSPWFVPSPDWVLGWLPRKEDMKSMVNRANDGDPSSLVDVLARCLLASWSSVVHT